MSIVKSAILNCLLFAADVLVFFGLSAYGFSEGPFTFKDSIRIAFLDSCLCAHAVNQADVIATAMKNLRYSYKTHVSLACLLHTLAKDATWAPGHTWVADSRTEIWTLVDVRPFTCSLQN